MANIVHRDHPETYTYLFRHAHQSKTKLIFTEIYANEQVFLEHASGPEFSKLYHQALILPQVKAEKNYALEMLSIVHFYQ